MAFHLYNQKKQTVIFTHMLLPRNMIRELLQGFFWKTDVSVKSQMSLSDAKAEQTHHPDLLSSWQMSAHIILPFHKQILAEWEIKANPAPAAWESKTSLKC